MAPSLPPDHLTLTRKWPTDTICPPLVREKHLPFLEEISYSLHKASHGKGLLRLPLGNHTLLEEWMGFHRENLVETMAFYPQT